MLVIASRNADVGIGEAMHVLEAGGSVLDAVEAGIRLVEANPQDHSVGYGGFPDVLGQVALDAGIMDGGTLASGAVAALLGYPHPISVARQVLEKLPHVLLVGDGAGRFAREMGFTPAELLTAETIHEVWEKGLQMPMTPENLQRLAAREDLWRQIADLIGPRKPHGTVNVIARDDRGNLGVGTSTAGWPLRYPGRVGDTPIVGAGLYADSRYGAAACTGMGEMAIRASTAHSVVFYLKMGRPLLEAGRQAMADLNDLGGDYIDAMNLIAVDDAGRHAGFTSALAGVFDTTYIYMADGMDAPAEAQRVYVPIRKRWGPSA
jgi:beta-aspartyl-peptidase (threonine type)